MNTLDECLPAKSTGLAWMPSVSATWSVMALARITLSRCDGPFGSAIKSENYVDAGVRVVRLQNIGPGQFRNSDGVYLDEEYVRSEIGDGHWVEAGDLLIAGLGDENNPLGRACVAPEGLGPSIVKADCYRFRLNEKRANAKFVAAQLAVLAQAECGFLATGSTRQRLNLGLAASRFVALPPTLDDQGNIVRALEIETARIDALIEKKTRFIELLREKRQALITQAVTQGLDPSVPMKDSGVAWLGKVPVHWSLVRLKHVIRQIEQGWSPECLAFPAAPGEWGVVKSGCVNRGSFHPGENKCLPPNQEPREDIEIKAGDILMSRASGSPELIGSVARALPTSARLMLSDKIFRIRLGDVDPDFFAIMMSARPIRLQIELSISGAEGLANNLPQSAIKEFLVVMPPRSEQVAIAKQIELSTRRIDNLISATRASISLLVERRSALITAAVTGQIDLREAA